MLILRKNKFKNQNFYKNQCNFIFLSSLQNNMRYLDPKNDLTFKKIFGEHPNLLISLLNSL
ncbi:MAG: hypothetical protein EAZ97_14425, partial [Bacteroidetes bacterium]